MNPTTIPSPRSDFAKPEKMQDGATVYRVTREWYLFLMNLHTITGGGAVAITLPEIAARQWTTDNKVGMLTLEGEPGEDGISIPGPMGLRGADGANGMHGMDGEDSESIMLLQPLLQQSAQVLDSNVYTPTLTNVANLAASTAYQCQYSRVGSVVTVSGKVAVDPTLAATSTQLGISLPIASNIGANEDCSGVAFASGIAAQGAAILGDAANDRAQMQFVSADLTNQAMYFTFQYRII